MSSLRYTEPEIPLAWVVFIILLLFIVGIGHVLTSQRPTWVLEPSWLGECVKAGHPEFDCRYSREFDMGRRYIRVPMEKE